MVARPRITNASITTKNNMLFNFVLSFSPVIFCVVVQVMIQDGRLSLLQRRIAHVSVILFLLFSQLLVVL